MRLTAPTNIVFYISLLALIIGLIIYFAWDGKADLGYFVTLGGGVLLAAGVGLKDF